MDTGKKKSTILKAERRGVMAKTKRGKNIKNIPNWRGSCSNCERTGVKLLWDKRTDNGGIKVCKICGNK